MPNYDPDTGIPYGTIYLHHLDSDLAQELWCTHGEDISYKNALEELRSEIAVEAAGIEEDAMPSDNDLLAGNQNYVNECIDAAYSRLGYEDREDFIEVETERRGESIQIDEPTIEGEYEGVKYMISWLGGAPLLWVFRSPYTGSYAQCSPCVPGAGDLETPDEYGVVCYDVPPDWRRDEDH